MVPSIRKVFNEKFKQENYEAFLKELDNYYPDAIEFRLAETPIFIPKDFTNKMLEACESIIDLITDPEFLSLTDNSIKKIDKVPGAYSYPQMLVFDYGICTNEEGKLEPQLIEMQGFPSLYAFQVFYPDFLNKYFYIPDNYTHFLGGHNHESYLKLFKQILLGAHAPENVILLEIKPDEQKTRVDFYCTYDLTGVWPVCLTELIREGREIYYLLNGRKTKVNRIYNRIIFDELNQRKDIKGVVDLTQDLDVEWVPHPDWFYRISKFTLPLISSPYVPKTYYLNEVKLIPDDLENYVLKPLFSFAGQGVVIDITPADIEKIEDPQNWILQRKVNYADVIETPGTPAKAEIRLMYLWKEGEERPEAAINLARLSKGKMIGTRYNKDKDWVGGTVALFEQ